MAAMDNLPAHIGPYRIVRQLGEGGMGFVYEAVHEAIGRRAARKLLRPEYAHNAAIAARFVNEARAVNRGEPPGIVQVFDHGRLPDGATYIVMEYLSGETLAQRMDRSGGLLPVAVVLPLGWQLADSLAAAHAQGIIHRDIKPHNVMLVPDPSLATGQRTKLLDFGLAKLTGATAPLSKTRARASPTRWPTTARVRRGC